MKTAVSQAKRAPHEQRAQRAPSRKVRSYVKSETEKLVEQFRAELRAAQEKELQKMVPIIERETRKILDEYRAAHATAVEPVARPTASNTDREYVRAQIEQALADERRLEEQSQLRSARTIIERYGDSDSLEPHERDRLREAQDLVERDLRSDFY